MRREKREIDVDAILNWAVRILAVAVGALILIRVLG